MPTRPDIETAAWCMVCIAEEIAKRRDDDTTGILSDARETISDVNHWLRGVYRAKVNGQFHCCAVGALLHAGKFKFVPGMDHDVINELGFDGVDLGPIIKLNDWYEGPGTNSTGTAAAHAQVLEMYDIAIELSLQRDGEDAERRV